MLYKNSAMKGHMEGRDWFFVRHPYIHQKRNRERVPEQMGESALCVGKLTGPATDCSRGGGGSRAATPCD